MCNSCENKLEEKLSDDVDIDKIDLLDVNLRDILNDDGDES
jgi:hypothetical protein